ncbi:hypothetical protein JKF63_07803 [Porcisia hertigi]|uniref:DNA excision/repair protein SNF2 n=1 Tax=Porcisia hertigi TaxID=2761500 RepID=A0A836YIE9_9TRYP|nr:hypothetical protein JKF63_07803 [Porcisia hertigi]
MEDDDDLLNDLLSWTPSKPCGSSTKSGAHTVAASSTSPSAVHRHSYSGSLRETCVNTETGTPNTGKADTQRSCHNANDADETRRVQSTVFASAETSPQLPPLPSPSPPLFHIQPDIDRRLYPHQREGVQWLYSRHCKSRACLLADEMGLGKTVQVAVFLGQLYANKMVKTTILIVPPTLVPVWTAAIAEWGGVSLAPLVEVIHSESRPKRQARWQKLRYGLPCVLLTTYGVLRQDAADMSATLVDYVVLDEVHWIKDSTTSVFKKALTLSARHKIALTGTPLMNTFNDMWSIFRFLDGSIIDMEKSSFNAVSGTLLRGNQRDASAAQREAAAGELARLQAAIRPFMLRREKRDVATGVLSSRKEDVVVWVRLTNVQQELYAAFLNSKEVTTARDGAVDVDIADSSVGEEGIVTGSCPGADDTSAAAATASLSSNPLLLLTMLSQICSHPWLSLVDEAFVTALARHPYEAPVAELGDIFSGSKLWVALRLVVRCVSDQRKVLVFSRSKRLLHLLSFLLREWRLAHTQVDGDMPSERRCAEVDRFNSDAGVWVCLLTTQVGGVGLTFTGASAVVLLDPSWNPSADDQAVDRVHRIGQQRDVVIFRLVTCGTVEEKIYRNQIFKRMAALQSTKSDSSGGRRRSPTPQADGDLYRYFTRVQLRSMFVMEDLVHTSTAEQLELLHPGQVRSQLREELCKIEGVCNVSDNASVLTETVAADAGGRHVAQRVYSPLASPERMCCTESLSPAPSQASPSQQTMTRLRSRSHDLQETGDASRRHRVDVEGSLPNECVAREGYDGFANH